MTGTVTLWRDDAEVEVRFGYQEPDRLVGDGGYFEVHHARLADTQEKVELTDEELRRAEEQAAERYRDSGYDDDHRPF